MPARKQNAPTTPKSTDGEKKRVAKTYAPVNLDELKPRKVTKEEKVTVIPGRERSDAQKAVDVVVKENAYDYLHAGSPKAFRDMPVVAYTLPGPQAETVKFMIQKACNLLNCKPKFGRPAWEGGLEVVTFCAIPRVPSQWTDVGSEEDTGTDLDKDGKPIPGEGVVLGSEKTVEAPKPAAPKSAAPKTDPAEFMKDA